MYYTGYSSITLSKTWTHDMKLKLKAAFYKHRSQMLFVQPTFTNNLLMQFFLSRIDRTEEIDCSGSAGPT